MIQCVGSRLPENPNCSRICCQSAIKNALRMLDLNPEMQVFVLYRDMRTYGFSEDAYAEARRRGVIFVRYEADTPPEVTPDGDQLKVTFTDPIIGRKLVVSADCLALSTGMAVNEEATEDLARIFHLTRGLDGSFLEEHVKLRPMDLPFPDFSWPAVPMRPRLSRSASPRPRRRPPGPGHAVQGYNQPGRHGGPGGSPRSVPPVWPVCGPALTGSRLSTKIAIRRSTRPSVTAAVFARLNVRPRRSSSPGLRMRRSWRALKA